MGDDPPAELLANLASTALEVRREVVRMTYSAGGGHPGGSLSAVELLTALLGHEMRLDPAQPDWPERDRLVLSKGHAAPALYAALALRGFLPREELLTFRKLGSRLQGLPDRTRLPCLDASTGGLGQGIGMAVGMALDARLAGRMHRVFAVLGDGECQTGATWEALLAGAHFRLAHLVVVVDRNGFETDGPTESIMGIDSLVEKFRAFRYHTVEIDGHDFRQILGAFDAARTWREGPTAIVARTMKGKGVSFLEEQHSYHDRPLTEVEARRALDELGASGELPTP